MSRIITHRYDDPLDLIWLACIEAIGWRIERSAEVYASFDGERTLTLSTREHFDADDSLAQLIFHEVCHALVAGPRGVRRMDWGMENVDTRDLLQEHACHRVQAALADRYGLRGLFAVTTEHRTYWDALPIDTLGPSEDPALPLALDAFERALTGPWSAAIAKALEQTRVLAASMRALDLPPDSLWTRTRSMHASGFPLGETTATCSECAWSHRVGVRLVCRQSRLQREQTGMRRREARVGDDDLACVRFEPQLSAERCGACGACCREAFDRVELGTREVARAGKRLLPLVVVDGFGPHVPRPAGRCVALRVENDANTMSYRCTVYDERPRSCAHFEIAGDACLTARRRVGLSA